VPESVGNFQLLERLGTADPPAVFRARDTAHGRTVAFRWLTGTGPPKDGGPEASGSVALAEARATAGVSHPHLATLFEVGDDGGRLYAASEFVPGQTLTRVLAGQPMHPRRAADLAARIADALAEAHAAGIAHRDVRPDNIIVAPSGQVKLTDLGLTAWTRGGRARLRAASGAHDGLGTDLLAYLSPEQALGQASDPRTDIFSLGAALYTMLTGTPPFRGATVMDLVVDVLKREPAPPGTVNTAVTPALDRIVARALAKSLDRRYQSAAEMAADLRAAAEELEARPAAAPLAIQTAPRRRRWPLVLLMLVLVLAAAVAVALYLGSR
jgi:serine/threonine protein kinase